MRPVGAVSHLLNSEVWGWRALGRLGVRSYPESPPSRAGMMFPWPRVPGTGARSPGRVWPRPLPLEPGGPVCPTHPASPRLARPCYRSTGHRLTSPSLPWQRLGTAGDLWASLVQTYRPGASGDGRAPWDGGSVPRPPQSQQHGGWIPRPASAAASSGCQQIK